MWDKVSWRLLTVDRLLRYDYHTITDFDCQHLILKTCKNFLMPCKRDAVFLLFTFHTLEYSQTFYNAIIEICLKSLL